MRFENYIQAVLPAEKNVNGYAFLHSNIASSLVLFLIVVLLVVGNVSGVILL